MIPKVLETPVKIIRKHYNDKACDKCNTIQPFDNFAKIDLKQSNGRMGVCIACTKKNVERDSRDITWNTKFRHFLQVMKEEKPQTYERTVNRNL